MRRSIHRGPASLVVGDTEAVPLHMRERVKEVSNVHVEAEQRRQGHASRLLQEVCSDADMAGIVLLLSPSPEDEGMTIDNLASWYARFGFVEIQAEPMLMARAPKQQSWTVH